MRFMGTPPPRERRIKRYDLRETALFGQLIAERPRTALLLAALIAFAGLALVIGWVPTPSATRGFGPWFVAVLAWLLALVIAVLAIRAWGAAASGPK